MINLNKWCRLYDLFFISICKLLLELAVPQCIFFSTQIFIGLKKAFHQSVAFIFFSLTVFFFLFSAPTFDDDEASHNLGKIQCNCNQKAAV